MIYYAIGGFVVLTLLVALLHWYMHRLLRAEIRSIQTAFNAEKKRATTEHAIRAEVCSLCKRIGRKHDQIDGKIVCHECIRKLNASS